MREDDGKRRIKWTCAAAVHLNSPGSLVYACLVEKSGLRLADNCSHISFIHLLEIGRHFGVAYAIRAQSRYSLDVAL